MSYKIVRITNLYDEYLQQYYLKYPFMQGKSYDEQSTHLTNDSLDTASSFVRNLNAQGVEAYHFFTNAIHLQDQWRIEHNSTKIGKELCAEQIKSLKPDVVWLDDIRLIDADWISALRKSVPSLKVVTGHLCAPYYKENLQNLKALDFLITCTPCLRQEFESNGIKTYLLYHGFDHFVLDRISGPNAYPKIDLLFTGSLYTGGLFHIKRIEFMEQLLRSGVPLKMYGNIDTNKKVFSKFAAYYLINSLRALGAEKMIKHIPFLNKYESYGNTPVKAYSRKLKANLLPAVYGLEQFKLLAKSQMTFNLHAEIARSCAGNARLFEATGVGSCLITDWKENLSELFEAEKEVVTYRSKEECADKIKWLLENPLEIQKIAKAGQLRTLKDHNMENRVKMFNELIMKRLQ
jgi:spore maturation protein CgeB